MRQLGNIKTVATKASYASYKMANGKLGNDLFDAACAGLWALGTRGAEDVPTVIGYASDRGICHTHYRCYRYKAINRTYGYFFEPLTFWVKAEALVLWLLLIPLAPYGRG